MFSPGGFDRCGDPRVVTAGLVPGHTRACVVGMAGTSKLSDPAIAAVFERTWQQLGLDGVVSVNYRRRGQIPDFVTMPVTSPFDVTRTAS